MCGIAGILSNNHSVEALETRIQWMQKAQEHRGPDDRGIYFAPTQQAVFAHTRLSILDLSSAGHQPMSIDDGRYWITFNGEIYNFKELRKKLIAKGEEFNSNTDTEVILKLYKHQGKDCVNDLRGMFAFAIWDDLEKTCFLARDPLGIKPLYYYQEGSTLVFASELKAILASKLPKLNFSSEGLYGYLITGTVPEPYTMIDGIETLEAGHWLFWQNGNLTKKYYWQIELSLSNISQAEAMEKTRKALIESIKYHFISDVPVGIFLSGGIDSTSVLALARQTQTGMLKTYSIAFAENEWNEGEVAKKTAQHFETEHIEYKVTCSIGRDLFEDFLEQIDQPSIDGFNTFCVSQISRQDGTKVVLSGLGGDEFFGGYQSFQKIPKMVRWGQKLQTIKPMTNILGRMLTSLANSPRYQRLGDFLVSEPTSSNAYLSFRGIFSHQEAVAIAKQYLPDFSTPFSLFSDPNLNQQPSLEDQVSYLEISRYMRNQLLRDSDVMSMAHGLELRVPLVDQVLLETIASIPSEIRLAQGKKLLIKSIPELPEWVINRPKQGFSFPYQKWLGGEWKHYFNSFDAPKNVNIDLWYRRWALGILNYWWQQVIK
ncbi:MAG: asparagine synthase (glutamine-hydrolyzing) [Gomphosphaeria aponina SAG 52.96 = DSM 107014]|uniref:asparagine synthase (glutamine-hydrolyzing) n=1 Tax=Gomphosphaeria aponina SAG 52.96 = DSM 107014 TaxID=1521640 RepID=A0A941GV59_9CHRO|nr:asparagine synthase (glutamine-hydrolyzing) [Gomphosphaeria aponina SAG 52.96 = DSM 107014]